ncbi:MAG: tripartite tricarboxylate transporter permease [Verrucomicrobiota bacterium]
MIEIFTSPAVLGLILLGTALGITVGAIPGLTGTMLIALALPLTYAMDPVHALVLLVSMYVGAVSGGLISATLLRMPGTPAAIMTTLDGYPMARAGQPGRALGLGVGASLAGGLVSWLALWLFAEPLADWSTLLGPFEYFSLVVLALALLAGVGDSTRAKGLLAGTLGILAAMPGTHPATGELRWTFGYPPMNAGFELIPVLIGLFAIGKILSDIGVVEEKPESNKSHDSSIVTPSQWLPHWRNLLRSSGIGTLIGVLPGVGANIGSLAAYAAARRSSQDPDKFGHGSEEGIIASEAANNATVGGALIPLIALGMPGSVITAVLLGALILHGLQPGPLLFRQNPEAIHAIIGTMLVANIVMFLLMLVGARWVAKLSAVPRAILSPLVVLSCLWGAYALSGRWFDVFVMIGFGIAGWAMERLKLPLAPFVIGFVLAPVAEENLCAGLMASGGSYLPMLTRPVSLAFIGLALFLLARKETQRKKPQDLIS